MFFYGFDPTYILVLIGVIISLMASAKVKTTFSKYSRVSSRKGLTGAAAADYILKNAGIHDVTINHISGDLTDNFNPREKTLNLSDSVYNSTSVAAIGVAAHECGHAIQHAHNYAPLTIRNSIVPVAQLGSFAAWPIILIGIVMSWNPTLINIGIILFVATVAFQLITLPVEFNASKRALRILSESGMLVQEEVGGARKVLSAAAMTYVAAAAAAILQLLRLLILARGRD